MKINHNELKSIYRAYLKEKNSWFRKNCPSEDALVRLLRSESVLSGKKSLLNHIQECPFCIKEIQMIIPILREEKEFIEKIRALSKNKNSGKTQKLFFLPFRVSRKLVSLSAATLILMVAIFVAFFQMFHDFRYRGTDNTAIEITAPRKKILIYENDIEFKWTRVPEAKFYKLVIFDNSLYPVWESDKLSDNTVKLAPEVMKKMKDKSTYFLLVTSALKSGEKIESQLKEFKVIIKRPKNQYAP
ncbi:MAG: hypothetical protein GF421_00850 [Candidatus Aminicenantes bacterium]|nr:hypothetical protein [Candidatus Aminicenantes bacterium]